MNDKKKTPRRRSEDKIQVINLVVNDKVNANSAIVGRAIAEVNKGRTVKLTLRVKGPRVAVDSASAGNEDVSSAMTFNEVATALSGGAAVGLTALALAPASLLIAGLAAVVGVAVSGVVTKRIDSLNSRA
jgi:hypothetical protein